MLIAYLLIIPGENVLRRGVFLPSLEEQKCGVICCHDVSFAGMKICRQSPSEILSLGSNNGGERRLSMIDGGWIMDNN
jgi:hypothetical protein